MRPWQHAKSSAGKNGDWYAHLPIHEFMDSTKTACPDLRHRMILHNADLGPELAARAFPKWPEARTIALQHVEEDLGWTPTLADWLKGCDPAYFPRPLFRRLPISFDSISRRLTHAQGLADEQGSREVADLLMLPVQRGGPDALSVLFNGFGPAVVRAIIGGPRLVAGLHGGQTVFDPAHAAEAAIHWIFGTIPTLPEVVSALRHPPHQTPGDA